MAVLVRKFDQCLSLLLGDAQIYLNYCSCIDYASTFYPFYDY